MENAQVDVFASLLGLHLFEPAISALDRQPDVDGLCGLRERWFVPLPELTAVLALQRAQDDGPSSYLSHYGTSRLTVSGRTAGLSS